MKFGIDLRNKKTGADIFVIIFQAVSLLPLLYIFIASGYTAILGRKNILTVLFDFGINAMPRWEAMLSSFVYRAFSSEMAAYFLIPFIALALGIVSNRLLRGNAKHSLAFHYVLMALIIVDLVVRVLPFGFNKSFGLAVSIAAFALRLICLCLLAGDVIAYRRIKTDPTNK